MEIGSNPFSANKKTARMGGFRMNFRSPYSGVDSGKDEGFDCLFAFGEK